MTTFDPQPGEFWVRRSDGTRVQIVSVLSWRIQWMTRSAKSGCQVGYAPPSTFRRLYQREEAP